MLVTIRNLANLTDYLQHIEWALAHHAEHWRGIAPHIAFAVLSSIDAGRPIEVKERRAANGRPAIAAAVWIGGQRFCVGYNRRMGVVTLRAGTRVGRILWTFTPETAPDEVRAVFDTLRPATEAVAAA